MTTGKWRSISGAPLGMGLDLDSLLRSTGSDLTDDEEDGNIASYSRTIDEILNDSDSDSPSSPPPKPQPKERLTTPSMPRPVDESSPETLEEPSSSQTWRTRSRDLSSSASLSSLGIRSYSRSSIASSSSRPLPPLFGGVRTNAKPGAALAAAVAASRSVPTPHAAAIKNRRASSLSIEKVIQVQEPAADLHANVAERVDAKGLDLETSEIAVELEDDDDRGVSASMVFRSSSSEPEVLSEAQKEVFGGGANSQPMLEPEIDEPLEVRDDLVESGEFPTLLGVDEDLETLPLNPAFVDAEHESEHLHTEDLREQEIERVDFDSETPLDRGTGGMEEVTDIRAETEITTDQSAEQFDDSKKAEKKLRSSMKPLEWAEELEKRQASYGLHWEEGAAAQPMRLEGIRRGPPAVGYLQMDLDNAITRTVSSQVFKREHGSPQVVAIHLNYIAIGMTKGAVLVVPSKYNPHTPDNMDSKMLTFGSHGEKSQASVSSMCFNQQGDLLLVGYGDGHLTIWDVQKAVALKVIPGEHTAAVVHTMFLGQDSQATRQFKAVTGDSKGLVLWHTFSVVPLLNRVSVKTQCLLDGQKTGTVLSASTILMDDSVGLSHSSGHGNSSMANTGLSSMVGGVVGEAGWKLFNEGSSLAEEGVVIFVTHQNALVVKLSTNVEVYEKFNRPDGVREGSMPYTAWKSTAHAHGSAADPSEKTSWLVIAWDRTVQVASLVKSEMKKHMDWRIDSTAIGVAWLDDQMLVVLTLRGQLCLFAKDGTELHRTNFVFEGSRMDDIILHHTYFTNVYGNPEKAYHNSVAVRGASVYILGPMHLIVSRLLPWKERIQVLQRAGDWMGALDMAMRLYDGYAHGVIDLPRTLDAIRESIMPYLVELILSYVDEVFSYISVAFCNQVGKLGQSEGPKVTESSMRSEIEEQYARVCGVAVEFCVHIKRNDILFEAIFSKFVAVQQGGTFLEILEPYILKDMLGCLPPEVMQALVEHYSAKGWLHRVEQCILHMDIASLDFNQVVKLCREHGLYGALIYIFNRGLDDYRTPLEELLGVLQTGETADIAAIGYRMLVYLKYCFQGVAFPPGHGTLSASRFQSLTKELMQFLLEDSKDSSSEFSRIFKSSCGTCPNLCYLLWLDTEATLEVLRCAFRQENFANLSNQLHDVSTSTAEDDKNERFENQDLMAQSVIKMFTFVLDLESDLIRSFDISKSGKVWPSKKDLGHLFEFITFLVTRKLAIVSGVVLNHILEYLISYDILPCDPSQEKERREKQALALLKLVPKTDWNASYVLELCVAAQFHQACGFIHTIRGNYVAALDCYMGDFNEPLHAFAFIHHILGSKNSEELSFRSAVLSRIPALVKLSRECTFFLVNDHFSNESQQILSELHSHPQSLFLFLKTVVEVHLSGTLKFSVAEENGALKLPFGWNDSPSEMEVYWKRLSDFPKLLHHNEFRVTDDLAELYLELMCQYEHNSVLKFLETFENYRLEQCLRLCQEYEVTDAAAFLLEKVGDVGSALQLLMSELEEKFELLIAAVENTLSDVTSTDVKEIEIFNDILCMNEVNAVHDVLRASIGLCQRNTKRSDDRHDSESLWFQLLDSFSEPLKMTSHEEIPEGWTHSSKASTSLDTQLGRKPCLRWRFSNLEKNGSILRRLFTQFIGEIIEGMSGNVPLAAIMSKLLSDHGNQEFGDFKSTILRMLGSYGYERRILDTAKSLIEDDTFYIMSLLRKGVSNAYAPHDFTCCICGCSLWKDSSLSKIRVFNCGHSSHLHCESEENEQSSRVSSAGCPICLPKKNSRARNKSVLVGNGLVMNGTSSSQTMLGISSFHHLHEPEVVEKPYGLHQTSRFEILSNLQKARKSLQADNLPQLRLSPPAIYHEKVQKGDTSAIGEERSITLMKNEKPNRRRQMREKKSKGSLGRFALPADKFGPEKNRRVVK